MDEFDDSAETSKAAGAMNTSLWELAALKDHYHPSVSTLVGASFFFPLQEQSTHALSACVFWLNSLHIYFSTKFSFFFFSLISLSSSLLYTHLLFFHLFPTFPTRFILFFISLISPFYFPPLSSSSSSLSSSFFVFTFSSRTLDGSDKTIIYTYKSNTKLGEPKVF